MATAAESGLHEWGISQSNMVLIIINGAGFTQQHKIFKERVVLTLWGSWNDGDWGRDSLYPLSYDIAGTEGVRYILLYIIARLYPDQINCPSILYTIVFIATSVIYYLCFCFFQEAALQ